LPSSCLLRVRTQPRPGLGAGGLGRGWLGWWLLRQAVLESPLAGAPRAPAWGPSCSCWLVVGGRWRFLSGKHRVLCASTRFMCRCGCVFGRVAMDIGVAFVLLCPRATACRLIPCMLDAGHSRVWCCREGTRAAFCCPVGCVVFIQWHMGII
jgi:hypothetical protein